MTSDAIEFLFGAVTGGIAVLLFLVLALVFAITRCK